MSVVSARRRSHGEPSAPLSTSGCGALDRVAATGDLGEALAQQVERQSGEDDRRTRRQRPGRVDVDPGEPLVEHPTPVVERRLHAEAEERQGREGEQGGADRRRHVEHDRLGDVRQDVAGEQAGSRDAEHAGGGDVVGSAGRRGERVREPGEGRGPGDAEGDDRPSGADTEHDGDEQGEDQTREGHEHVDQPGEGAT